MVQPAAHLMPPEGLSNAPSPKRPGRPGRQDRAEPADGAGAGAAGAGDLPGVVRGLRAGEGQGRRRDRLPLHAPARLRRPAHPLRRFRHRPRAEGVGGGGRWGLRQLPEPRDRSPICGGSGRYSCSIRRASATSRLNLGRRGDTTLHLAGSKDVKSKSAMCSSIPPESAHSAGWRKYSHLPEVAVVDTHVTVLRSSLPVNASTLGKH